MIWSTQPALTRSNTGQLARLLPKLLSKLREGLSSIDYPADRTEAVFELLMQLHQRAFQTGAPVGTTHADKPAQAAPPAGPKAWVQPAPLADEDPWVAPAEAKESGYMDVSQAPEPESAAPAPAPITHKTAQSSDTSETSDTSSTSDTVAASALPQPTIPITVGSWVNLLAAGEWERTQLSWIGSHGNLFLFTSASGRTQSMTLRLLERLVQQGAIQVVAEQTVVDGALDAVAQMAMHNSVESRL